MPRRLGRPPTDPRRNDAATLPAMSESEPVDAEPVDAEPVDAEPVDAEPVDAEPVDAERVGAEPRSDATGDPDATGPRDDTALLGAYALGALSAGERAAVEERLAASPALQDELRRLIPVAALLREATDAPPRPATEAPTELPTEPIGTHAAGPVPDPSAGPVLEFEPPSPVMSGDAETSPPARHGDEQPARDGARPLPRQDAPAASASSIGEAPEESAPPVVRVEAAPGSLSSQPAGRRRATAVTATPRPLRTPRPVASWPPSWVAAGLATLVAIGAVLWALALVDRLDTRRQEVDALTTELSRLRARGDAAVVPLTPGESGPAEAEGVAVLVPTEGSIVVRVSGLPPSEEGRVYQVWFQDQPDDRWQIGPVFQVGDGGTAVSELPVAAPPFTRVAISEERSPGGDEPSGALLLEGTVAAAG